MASFTDDTDSSYEKKFECKEIVIDSEPVHGKCCIYKVPKRLRKVKKQAYTPKLISIGPVHHGNPELQDMEMLKQTYCNEFLGWIEKDQKDFESIIKENEKEIRKCYSAEITMSDGEKFLNMILLDSIFIIVLFLGTAQKLKAFVGTQDAEDQRLLGKFQCEDDYILSKPCLIHGIMQDLILLENQLPFFILDKIYRHIGRFEDITFHKLACKLFFSESKDTSIEIGNHFTDLHRNFFDAPDPLNEENGDTTKLLPSATKLDTAGLIFEKKDPENDSNKNRSLLKVCTSTALDCSLLVGCLPCFEKVSGLEGLKTILLVPQFMVDDGTEDLFRNLMALEQCHYPKKAYICNYISLLDSLINNKEDVELLVEKGIIVNLLGSNEVVAKMVNKLGHEIVETSSYYLDVAKALDCHYKSKLNQNMASLKKVYFRDIWRGTATVVGVLVLAMSIFNFLKPFIFKNL